MSFERHVVGAPAGEILVVLLKLMHPTWGTPLLYAFDNRDWIVTDENDEEQTFPEAIGECDAAPTDDTGIDSRRVTIHDLQLTLWRRLERLSRTGEIQPVDVTVYTYLSTDTTQPAQAPAVLQMASPSRRARIVTFEASTINTINRDAPTRKFTWANSPGLRR